MKVYSNDDIACAEFVRDIRLGRIMFDSIDTTNSSSKYRASLNSHNFVLVYFFMGYNYIAHGIFPKIGGSKVC